MSLDRFRPPGPEDDDPSLCGGCQKDECQDGECPLMVAEAENDRIAEELLEKYLQEEKT